MPGLLPPMILELRAVGSQLFGELKKTEAAVTKTATTTEVQEGRMQAAMDKTVVAGKGLALGFGVAAAAVAGISIKMASDFQSKMTLLQTAAGESQANIGKVSDGILNLAGATGTSIEQLSEGMYTIEKSGNRGAAGLNILKAAAEGAKAENVDLSVATNALTSVMMSYHLKAKDAVKVQNEMIAGSGLAKTTMQEYAGSLSAVLPVASSAGIGFDQVAGAIATLTQHGTSAQESTQELANTIRSLQAPNQVASKMMQQLGINVTDLTSNLGKRGLTGTINLITDAIGKQMGPSGLVVVDTFKKSQSAAADAQTELSKMPASLQKVAKAYLDGTVTQKEWRKELKNMDVGQRQLAQQFAGTVNQSRGFNDMLKSGSPAAQTFAGTLNKVMGGATGMNTALMLGGENMAYFKKATEEVGNAGQKTGAHISTWAKTQKNLSVQVAQAGEGIAAMGVRLGTVLIPFVSQAIKTGEQFVNFLGKNPPLLITIASIIGGVVLIAITAWIGAVTKKIALQIQSMALDVKDAAVWVAKKIAIGATTVAMLAQNAATKAGAVATGIAMSAQKAWSVVQFMAKASTLEYIAALVAQKAAMVAGAVAQGVMTAAQWAFNVAADANPIGLIILAIAALIAIIILVVTHWKEVTKFLGEAWKNVGDFFVTIGTAIAKWWNGFWDGIVGWVRKTFGPVIEFVINYFKNMQLGLKIIGDAVSKWWNGLWNGVVSFVQSVWKGAANGIIGFFNGVIDVVDGLIGGLNQVLAGIKTISGGAINLTIGKIPHLPSFDVGGIVPGATGQPTLALVHGGEPILSHAMMAGRAPIPQPAVDAVNRQQGRGGHQVTIMAQTNATPRQIAASVGWELKRMG